ncbi:MAG: copper chaperone PCu(A)C [Arenimonas sp.]
MSKSLKLILIIVFLIPALALSHSYKLGSLQIEHPWSSPTPPNVGVAGGYLTIRNSGENDDILVGATTSAAASVGIHEMKMANGVMQMRELANGLPIAAGKMVILAPGKYHMMFIPPKKQWKDGDRIPVTLVFKYAGKLKVEFAVQADKPETNKHSHH